MATGDTHQAIDLPAVRAHMGDWTYLLFGSKDGRTSQPRIVGGAGIY